MSELTQYNTSRYYDPGLGRHVPADPIVLTGGIDAYGYARSKPLSGLDPFGLDVNYNGFVVNNPKVGRRSCADSCGNEKGAFFRWNGSSDRGRDGPSPVRPEGQ